jgi:hypothetical protein
MNRCRPGRSPASFEVSEALEESGCPVCRLGLHSVSRYLAGLAYEHVNDPDVRAELRESNGFCSMHARQFLDDVHDGIATAIIFQDIVRTFLRRLYRPRARWAARWPATLLARVLGRDRIGQTSWHTANGPMGMRMQSHRTDDCTAVRCPACRAWEEATSRYLTALLSAIAEPAIRAGYERSSGLCIPHTLIALRWQPSAETTEFLIDDLSRRLRSLDAELSEYLRKQDYRCHGEPWGTEASAPRRAVAQVAGLAVLHTS